MGGRCSMYRSTIRASSAQTFGHRPRASKAMHRAWPFDVSADGRLLLLERTISKGAPLAVVKNWREELKEEP